MRHIPIHNGKISAAEQVRADRVHAIASAEGALRSYRIINGLGTEYRVEATSAYKAQGAFREQHRINPGVEKLQVIENGSWVYVV